MSPEQLQAVSKNLAPVLRNLGPQIVARKLRDRQQALLCLQLRPTKNDSYARRNKAVFPRINLRMRAVIDPTTAESSRQ